MIDQLEKNVPSLNSAGQDLGSPLDQIETIYGLANLYSYQGAMDKAVAQWESAYKSRAIAARSHAGTGRGAGNRLSAQI